MGGYGMHITVTAAIPKPINQVQNCFYTYVRLRKVQIIYHSYEARVGRIPPHIRHCSSLPCANHTHRACHLIGLH
jgi:hypothetical protein